MAYQMFKTVTSRWTLSPLFGVHCGLPPCPSGSTVFPQSLQQENMVGGEREEKRDRDREREAGRERERAMREGESIFLISFSIFFKYPLLPKFCCPLTSITGGEKGALLRLEMDTFCVDPSNSSSPQHFHRCACNIKVFKDKGADRKQRQDQLKMEKLPQNDLVGGVIDCIRHATVYIIWSQSKGMNFHHPPPPPPPTYPKKKLHATTLDA